MSVHAVRFSVERITAFRPAEPTVPHICCGFVISSSDTRRWQSRLQYCWRKFCKLSRCARAEEMGNQYIACKTFPAVTPSECRLINKIKPGEAPHETPRLHSPIGPSSCRREKKKQLQGISSMKGHANHHPKQSALTLALTAVLAVMAQAATAPDENYQHVDQRRAMERR